MKHLYFALSFVLFFAYTLSAQYTNPLDEEYTPDQNSHFGSNSARVFSSGYQEELTVKHIIKFPLTQLARAEFALNYEYRFTPTFSIRGGLGYAFGRDFVQFLPSLMEFNDEIKYRYVGAIDLNELLLNTIYKKASISQYIGLRINNTEFNSFIEIGFKNANQNMVFNSSSYSIYDPMDTKTNSQFYYLGIGTTHQRGVGKFKFVNEISINLGIRKTKWDEYSATDISQTVTKYTLMNKQARWITPHIAVRYELGFGF